MSDQVIGAKDVHGNHDDAEYIEFLGRVQNRFLANVNGNKPLFTTEVPGEDLWLMFLDTLPPEQRQFHTCHACRHFIERFGGLVTIDNEGYSESAIWNENDAYDFYVPAVQLMRRQAVHAKVTGVFYSKLSVWGLPKTGIWRHVAITPPKTMIFRETPVKTAFQAMAEKAEEYKSVKIALHEFNLKTLELAVTLLKGETLYRGEKVLGPAEWLFNLQTAFMSTKVQHNKRNILWEAIATAPAGFCHPRSSMVGTLLQDLANGMTFEDAAHLFADKMHPLKYQRPTEAPSAGNIAHAEKLVDKLGIKNSLRRRFAVLDEIQTFWKPTIPAKPVGEGVFSHLQPKGIKTLPETMRVPPITMTWAKFFKTVIPEALEMALYIPQGRQSFAALVTAADLEAPPIIQWDSVEQRNPFSWYLYNGGSSPNQWGLTAFQYAKVAALTLKPSMWYDATRYDHQGEGVLFVLENAKDHENTEAALFPEVLKSELREVRSTIEAFSKSSRLEGEGEASACGLMVFKGNSDWGIKVRVRTKLTISEYKLDRWD